MKYVFWGRFCVHLGALKYVFKRVFYGLKIEFEVIFRAPKSCFLTKPASELRAFRAWKCWKTRHLLGPLTKCVLQAFWTTFMLLFWSPKDHEKHCILRKLETQVSFAKDYITPQKKQLLGCIKISFKSIFLCTQTLPKVVLCASFLRYRLSELGILVGKTIMFMFPERLIFV